MQWVIVVLLLAGLLFLGIGYRKNNRNLMLVGGILLLLFGIVEPAAQGIIDGYRAQQGGP